MRTLKTRFALLGAITLLAGTAGYAPIAAADRLPTEEGCKELFNITQNKKGWCAAINRKKGNCLACHAIITSQWPKGLPPSGNIGPPLVGMKMRFPEEAKLREKIWDATQANPNTQMPPFGRHKLLSDREIDDIVAFLLSI
ncbi:MAG TPA: sulfur oxidation c-type cytochrome SoxX [Arenicellales bacterium]|jgi:sulfur-oxidizing protein SoxX|nr:sulfur oxidation c-type cytochrome SoxX [Acidiferrobacteraceae bacterium]MDP6122310.1 sulfur oxidation c-type cytochrome SoxX [Arenicellales bacterium]MDP7282866.1 sulfur oxidation c-type cytochrome SoxX [Arenicellales bacterium]MDP7521346.1 sulfur oxidation c-type cytochrome SoxX [Arenicellales bacterium]HJL65726.1 sulfur oxidation c-type cytochrome SoxX [Arenicellales bacterium]|tara:strand:- start:4232 stop:4654 length:423 start_codon:yes stop_codon:yes gene_type:complete